jgi:hypothetical protein
MTLDEAIKHCEEVAEEKESICNVIENNGETWTDSGKNYYDICKKCASEHRQLAEWLKELKAFRSGINCSTCKYREVDGIDHPCIYCHPSENRWEYGGQQ